MFKQMITIELVYSMCITQNSYISLLGITIVV